MSLYRHLGGRVVTGIVGLLLLLIPLASCGGSGQATTPTPTATPFQFVNFGLGIPAKALNSPVVGQVPDSTILHVIVTFTTNQAVLNRLAGKKIKAGQTTNLQSVANQIGISNETYARIKAYFGVQDATLKLGSLHTKLNIDAKASTFAELLQTHFVYHQYNGRKFFAPAVTPKLPKDIANVIVAITGLDNYSLPPQHSANGLPDSSITNRAPQGAKADCSPDPRLLTPADVAHAYGYDQFWKQGWLGQGMTVNLVEFEAYDPNDVQNYFDCVGFRGSLHPIDVGPTPTSGSGESTLDIEMIAGLAPAININVYETALTANATIDDFWTAYDGILQQIINDNANSNKGGVVSISWSQGEDSLTTGEIQAINNDLQVLVQAEHFTIFTSSGDCGAFGDRVYGQLSVRFPSSDPWSTSVGGTILAVNNDQSRNAEVAWSDGSDKSACNNTWGTGGGNSQYFQRPKWQNSYGVVNRFSNGGRQLPDVSAVAWALATYVGGHWILDGGTSAATPIWAAGFALVNQGLIQRTGYYYYGPDTFYQVADNTGAYRPFYDITRGNDLYYNATPGWDYPTGLGTPNLPDLFVVLYKSLQ